VLRIKELHDKVQAQATQLATWNKTLEQRVAELDPESDRDVSLLTGELERLGVEDALRAAGAKPGDEILLGAHAFTFQPEQPE